MLIYNLLRLKDTKEEKILVIVPTTSLVEQLFKDFKDYGIIVKEMYIEIYQAMRKKLIRELLYLLGNQFIIYLKKWFNQFGMI